MLNKCLTKMLNKNVKQNVKQKASEGDAKIIIYTIQYIVIDIDDLHKGKGNIFIKS